MSRERYARIQQVISQRQPDLAVVMENVHKPHNLAAIARTCDAVGVMQLHAIGLDEKMGLTQKSASGVTNWIKLRHHENLNSAFGACRDEGMACIALTVSEGARDFRDIDYTQPTAIVLGAELDGLSSAATLKSDHSIIIPMAGMVESLNVSVAAALVLFEAERQRKAAGFYDKPRLDDRVRQKLSFEWAQPIVADYCRRHGIDYPLLDDCGDVVAGEFSRNFRLDE